MSGNRTYSQDDVRDIVLGLYQDVLSSKDIGASDDFFDLGGDSTKGVQIIHRLYDEIGVKLTMAALFTGRTPEGVADEAMALLAS